MIDIILVITSLPKWQTSDCDFNYSLIIFHFIDDLKDGNMKEKESMATNLQQYSISNILRSAFWHFQETNTDLTVIQRRLIIYIYKQCLRISWLRFSSVWKSSSTWYMSKELLFANITFLCKSFLLTYTPLVWPYIHFQTGMDLAKSKKSTVCG